MRSVARREISRALSRAARSGAAVQRPRVLLHGDDPEIARLEGIELLNTLDYALPHVGSPDEAWLDAASNEMLYQSGAGFFPTVEGVSLADLCRLEVQDYYLAYAHLAGAVCRALADKPTSFCKIITIDPERAEALRLTIAGQVERAESWAPPFIAGLRHIGRTVRHQLKRLRRRDPHPARLSALQRALSSSALTAEALFISEATPMAQMFGVVERELSTQYDTRCVRLHLAGSRDTMSIETEAETRIAKFAHPTALRRGVSGRFRARWRATARESQQIVIDKPYAGAPGVTSLRAPVNHLLEHLYSERFDQLVEHIEMARTVIDSVQPEVLIVGNDRWWVGQTFVRLAQRRGIPTVLIQDGLASDKATWSWISADHVAAFSPALAKLLLSHGVSRERITITGQPRYDSLSKKRRTRTGACAGNRCVLLATQPHQDPRRVAAAVDAILRIDGARIVLRPHPNESPEKYAACVAMHSSRVSLGTGGTIDELLATTNVVVTEFSTVALEGAILGIPVIIARFLGDRSDPRVFDGLSTVVGSPESLHDAAQALLVGVGRQSESLVNMERLHALVGPLDGQSGNRAARLIHSLRRTGGREDQPCRSRGERHGDERECTRLKPAFSLARMTSPDDDGGAER